VHIQRFGESCFLLVVERVETQLRKFEPCAIIFSSWLWFWFQVWSRAFEECA
jgi:hypothetical protein